MIETSEKREPIAVGGIVEEGKPWNVELILINLINH